MAWSGDAVPAGTSMTLLFQTAPFSFHNCRAQVLRQLDGVVVLQFESALEQGVVSKLAA